MRNVSIKKQETVWMPSEKGRRKKKELSGEEELRKEEMG